MVNKAKDGSFSSDIVQPSVHNNPDTDANGVERVQDFTARTMPEGHDPEVIEAPADDATLGTDEPVPEDKPKDDKSKA